MARLFKYILSAVFLFASVPAVQAMDMKMDNMEEVKKKKKKKKRKALKARKRRKVSSQKPLVQSNQIFFYFLKKGAYGTLFYFRIFN